MPTRSELYMVREAAAASRATHTRQATDRPVSRHGGPFDAPGSFRREGLGTETVRNGLTVVAIPGYACVTESPYDMYDAFGVYTEIVTRGAFGATLLTGPLVEFTVNHAKGGGIPMAHTRNDTLTLDEDEHGLPYMAYVDPTRHDVSDTIKAIDRGDLAESSFKFRIDSGRWSPDYTEFRIDAVDLSRGDVSAVNFGANPATTVGRSTGRADFRSRVLALALTR